MKMKITITVLAVCGIAIQLLAHSGCFIDKTHICHYATPGTWFQCPIGDGTMIIQNKTSQGTVQMASETIKTGKSDYISTNDICAYTSQSQDCRAGEWQPPVPVADPYYSARASGSDCGTTPPTE